MGESGNAKDQDAVARAFDSMASYYDSFFKQSTIVRHTRELVYSVIRTLLPPKSTILDINCGTGADTISLFQEGYVSCGVDISKEMLRIAKRNAKPLGPTFYRSSYSNLTRFAVTPFDLVLSNNCGLNCTPELESVVDQISSVLRPGGYFVGVFLSPFSIWEFVAGILHRKPSLATRRVGRKSVAARVGAEQIPVYYHAPQEVRKAFGIRFSPVSIRGISILSPPPNSLHFISTFPILTEILWKLDSYLSTLPLVRSCGDLYLMVLRKKIP